MYVHINGGRSISTEEYDRLSYFDKKKYEKRNSRNIEDTIIDVGIEMAIGYGLSEIFESSDNNSSSSSSSSGFEEGFGGGDFSGGGSGGDWNE